MSIDSDIRDVLTATLDETDWFMLGVQLNVDHAKLERIQMNYPGRAQECQYHMLHTWIDTGNASWIELVTALRSPLINNKKLAQEIEEKYLK